MPGFGYYKLHTDVKTWPDALHTCQNEGAHLAIINSQEEAKALAPMWRANPTIPHYDDYAFIGFHDQYKEGQFLTVFSKYTGMGTQVFRSRQC